MQLDDVVNESFNHHFAIEIMLQGNEVSKFDEAINNYHDHKEVV